MPGLTSTRASTKNRQRTRTHHGTRTRASSDPIYEVLDPVIGHTRIASIWSRRSINVCRGRSLQACNMDGGSKERPDRQPDTNIELTPHRHRPDPYVKPESRWCDAPALRRAARGQSPAAAARRQALHRPSTSWPKHDKYPAKPSVSQGAHHRKPVQALLLALPMGKPIKACREAT